MNGEERTVERRMERAGSLKGTGRDTERQESEVVMSMMMAITE